MSRWRELLMDYGPWTQTASWKHPPSTYAQWKRPPSTSATSDVFSVDGDVRERDREVERTRRVLEENFRPLFQKLTYGGEKISSNDLQRILRDPRYRQMLPQDKVVELAELADFSKGRAIAYAEFVRIATGRNIEDDNLSVGSQTNLNDAKVKHPRLVVVCSNTVTDAQVRDRLARHNWCCPPPVFIIALTIVQLTVYFLTVSDDVDKHLRPLEGLPADNVYSYTPTRRSEAWRFISYCLIHDGYVDLILTVVLQLVVGIPLEIIFSAWRMFVVYVTGVIAGSLGQSVTDHYYGAAGGAGGLYAILAAHTVAMIHNWRFLNMTKSSNSSCRKVLCSTSLRVVVIVLAVLAQTGLAVYRRFVRDEPTVGIGPNVAGILAGVLLSRAFLTDLRITPGKKGVGAMDLFCILIYIGACVMFNILYDGYPEEENY